MTALLELVIHVIDLAIKEHGIDAPAKAIATASEAIAALKDAQRNPAKLADSMARLERYAPDRAAGLRAAQDALAERFPDAK